MSGVGAELLPFGYPYTSEKGDFTEGKGCRVAKRCKKQKMIGNHLVYLPFDMVNTVNHTVCRELFYGSSRGYSVCPIVEVQVVLERRGLGEGGVHEGRERGHYASMVCGCCSFERGGGPQRGCCWRGSVGDGAWARIRGPCVREQTCLRRVALKRDLHEGRRGSCSWVRASHKARENFAPFPARRINELGARERGRRRRSYP
jgi:hypothetical protein